MLAAIKTQPLGLWRDMHGDMGKWLSAPIRQSGRDRHWVPSVDVIEEKERYVFRADVPGVELDAIEVLFQEGTLTIKGERPVLKETGDEGFHHVERSGGLFQRSFHMPESIDSDKITAKSDKGVLEVYVPKKEKAQKKITVQG